MPSLTDSGTGYQVKWILKEPQYVLDDFDAAQSLHFSSKWQLCRRLCPSNLSPLQSLFLLPAETISNPWLVTLTGP